MTDGERAELFASLDRVVRDAGLDWVADEVTDLIDQGVEVAVPAEEWSGRGKPKRNEHRITRREYTPTERIELLIGATSRVLSQTVAIEIAVLQHFRPPRADDVSEDSIDVEFRSEPRLGDVQVSAFTIGSSEQLADRAAAIAELTTVLERVRAEAAAG